ncbi:MAG: glycosyl hydrolase [Bacteroidota bacterium]
MFSTGLYAQSSQPYKATSAEERLSAFAERTDRIDQSLIKNLPIRNVGPTVMSGRIIDLDVNPNDPSQMLVAYASGGLWLTESHGTTFEPLFDDQAVMTLGDVTADWERGIVWVGTGENNSSRSSYAGTGVYKSLDMGKTWQHMGLAETHRTGRIVIHPDNPDVVWVATVGALYSENPERGLYKTTDGGATWERTLFVDAGTGIIDFVIDPNNSDVLYATSWERSRTAWNFVEGGSGSAIYKSTDGGESWSRISTADSGFPTGEGVGRIGLAVSHTDSDIVYALLDNQFREEADASDAEETPALTRDALLDMTASAFLALADSTIETYLRDNRFPSKYEAASVRGMVERGEIAPPALVEYLEDANRLLFDTPVLGAQLYRSDDGGATWALTHDDPLGGLYFSYGYYFGEVRVDPFDSDKVFLMGVPILASDDGGATFESINGANVHVDHHALWVSDTRPGHLVNGNDGGLNISYDYGETWLKLNTPPVGQFYAIQVDDAKPYNVYGGLQDNGVWFGPSTYRASDRWHGSGDYPYERLMGGDGMQVEVDTRDNETIYTGSQFGFYARVNPRTGERVQVRPRHELGERPLRFNWQTPIHLSRHNQDILYLGANKLFRSMDQGETLVAISDDLTKGGLKGDVPYGTLTTIDESPLQFGHLLVGSDDGYVYQSPDGGVSWARISDDLPQDLWVSRVEASAHDKDRVYVTLNGYRYDRFDTWAYVSDNAGRSWRRLFTDVEAEPVNVIVEDPMFADRLYLGTDHGVYVSMDRGETSMPLSEALPHTPVHDLKLQARERDLVIGTHGRSIFIADLEELDQLTADVLAAELHVLELEDVMHSSRWGSQFNSWSEAFSPEAELPVFSAAAGTVELHVKAEDGRVLHRSSHAVDAGLNYLTYDLGMTEDEVEVEAADNGVRYLPEGTYAIEVTHDGYTATESLTVKAPRRRGLPAEPLPRSKTKI